MTQQDIRWIQRFNNYIKAFEQLSKFIEKDSLNELEEQGLVKAFEYTYELAWNVLKDLLEHQGYTDIIGSRGAIKEAFKQNLLGDHEEDGLVWMAMIKSRKMTSHAYNKTVIKEIIQVILNNYYPAFQTLKKRLEPLVQKLDD
ncbi:MAG: nucleotidyltransferase [Proteobacteria bacterium]|nr:nucleotidyltransferase [Pseudomonadota bacterium]